MEFTIWFKDTRIFLFYSKFHKIQVKLLNSDSMSLYVFFLCLYFDLSFHSHESNGKLTFLIKINTSITFLDSLLFKTNSKHFIR